MTYIVRFSFVRRKASEKPVAFTPGVIPVMIAAKANDAFAPHRGLLLGHLAHEAPERQAVCARPCVGNGGHKIFSVLGSLVRPKWGHSIVSLRWLL